MTLGEIVEALVSAVADAIADRVVTRLRGAGSEMVDQRTSRLGPRRHIRAVRRRLASHEPGAAQVGRTYLLSPEAVEQELVLAAQASGRDVDADDDDLARELGLERG